MRFLCVALLKFRQLSLMLQKSGYLSTRPRLAENKPRGQTFRRFCQPAAAAGDHRGTAAVPSHPRYSPKRMRSAARERRMCAVVRRTASGQTMLFSLQRIAGAAGSAGTHAHGCRRGGARRPFASPSGVHRFGVRSRTTRLVGAPNILTRCMSMSPFRLFELDRVVRLLLSVAAGRVNLST